MNNIVKFSFRKFSNLTVDPFVDDGSGIKRRSRVINNPWESVGRCFDNVGDIMSEAAEKEMSCVR